MMSCIIHSTSFISRSCLVALSICLCVFVTVFLCGLLTEKQKGVENRDWCECFYCFPLQEYLVCQFLAH